MGLGAWLMQVRARLSAIECLFEKGHPGLSALVIRRITHDTQALWPQADGAEVPQGARCSLCSRSNVV